MQQTPSGHFQENGRLSGVQASPENRKLTVVPADQVHSRLGFNERLVIPPESLAKPLNQWKMETDDAPIFRYLYRNFAPRRHLEFGTWQGFGTVLCLEECQASVWTINIPFGEKDRSGRAAYGSELEDHREETAWAGKVGLKDESIWSTDSLGFIGRHYLDRGLGHRVFQVYCDSTQWDASTLPPGFFDSILIDGGHTPEVVISDTLKALELLRPGGLIMWHDFCPPIYREFEGTTGVMTAVSRNWATIASATTRLFWIEPSWILVGIK
jgi:predicted O-methyltransferase YrrM